MAGKCVKLRPQPCCSSHAPATMTRTTCDASCCSWALPRLPDKKSTASCTWHQKGRQAVSASEVDKPDMRVNERTGRV